MDQIFLNNKNHNIIKIFKIILLIIILILINFYFYSCQIEDTSMKRVKIVSIAGTNEDEYQLKIFEHYKFSYIFYRKNFIYFFDAYSKTMYKFTKTGDILLKINFKNLDSFKKNSYLFPLEKESIKTKIFREFPFPEILGIFVDYNDNIYFKVNLKDLSLLFKKYVNPEYQKIIYIENNNNLENSNNNQIKETNENNIENINENINNRGINNENSNNENAQKFNIVFFKFDKYGNLKSIICKSKNNISFNYFTIIHFFKDNSFIIAEKKFSGNEEGKNEISPEKHDLTYFYLLTSKSTLIKKISFSLIDIPKTKTEINELYDIFIINYFITEDKSVLFNVFYYKNNIPVYYKIIKLENLNLNKIYTIYQKQLLVNKIINGEKKKVLLFGEYMLDVTPNNYYFFVRYIDEKKANLIIKDKYFKIVISKIINVEDIFSESQFFVGEDGSLYAYSDVGDNFNILYWASDVMLRKLKEK